MLYSKLFPYLPYILITFELENEKAIQSLEQDIPLINIEKEKKKNLRESYPLFGFAGKFVCNF